MNNEEIFSETMSERLEKSFSELSELLETKKYRLFGEKINEMNPVDIADFFEKLEAEQLPTVLGLIKKDVSAEVFAELDGDMREKLVSSMTDRQLSFVFEELYLDDAAEVTKELPANLVHRIMKSVTPETRAQINRLLSYPEDSAGSIMTTEYVTLRADSTVEEAFANLRRVSIDKETIYTCYVMSPSRKLEGVVTVKDLLLNDYQTLVGDIMDTHVIYAQTDDDKEEIANLFHKYDFLSLPVVDKDGALSAL